MRRAIPLAALCTLLHLAAAPPGARADDKAAVSWREFADRSTFVFAGLLTKAELLDVAGGAAAGVFRCTYKVRDTFKGEAVKEVTFDVPRREEANTEVGTLAV